MSDDMDSRGTTLATITLFALIGTLIAWDLAGDYGQGISPGHLFIEGAVLVATVVGIGMLWRQLRQTRGDLTAARTEASQWRNEHREVLQGLGAAIEQQFSDWALTNAEADVALLLLKGLSHREISGVRQTSERTIREQARAVYRKAGLSGRSELSAFFLEDLLLPDVDGRERDSLRRAD